MAGVGAIVLGGIISMLDNGKDDRNARTRLAEQRAQQALADMRDQSAQGLNFGGRSNFFLVDEVTNLRYDGTQSGGGAQIEFTGPTPNNYIQASGRFVPGDCWFTFTDRSLNISNIRATCMILPGENHIPYSFRYPNGTVFNSCLHLNHGATTICAR